MINIKLNELNVFTCNSHDNLIGIHQHAKGRYSGESRMIGSIEFYDLEQTYQFAEMINLLIEKKRKMDG